MGKKRGNGLTKRGNIWWVNKRINGESIRESTGTSVFAEAQEYLNLRLIELRESKVSKERPKRTFNESAARYILENEHKRSLPRDDLAIRTVMPFIGDLDIGDIHYGKLQVYVDDRLSKGIANATINRDMASVRAVLKAASTQWFHDNGHPWLVSIPSLPRLKIPKAGIRAITLKEQKALIREMPDYLAEMTLFTVNTGLRRGEVTALRWEWEVQDYPAFLLPAEAHKTGDHSGDKLVVCNSTAWSIVNSLRGKHPDRVFPKVTFMGRAWRKAREKAGLGSVRVHDLRHTFSTRLRAAGVSEDDRADLLGHSNPRMTRHYSAPDITRLLEAAETVVKMTHEPVLRVVGR